MPRKNVIKKSRRRLQPTAAAMMGSTLGAAAAGLGAHIATTFTGRGKQRNSHVKAYNKLKKGNLRGTGAKTSVRRANSEGYIPAYSKIIGNFKKGLSFTEKIQKIMNPPQVILTNTTQKFEASSGRQAVFNYTLNNKFISDYFGLVAATRSDGTAQVTWADNTAATNQINHLWTSVQHTFMNSGNLTAELDIYIFKSAQDIDSLDAPRNAENAWIHAESINTAPGIGEGAGILSCGKKPTDTSARFYIQRYWRLISHSSVQMKPGESFKHYFRHHYNKPVLQYMLHGDASACVKDHCLSFLYVLKGQVVGSSLTADISTGDAQISCVRNLKYSMCQGQNVRPRDMLIGTDLSIIGTANQIFINTDTSAQQTGFTEDV